MVEPRIKYKPAFAIKGMNAERAGFWMRSSARWGVFAGVTVVFFVSQVPRVKQDVLSKIPVIGSYWKDTEE
ncbi:hypothetical protein AX774_g3128 [Zancudomyces culisetae]|uniref:Cytochrome b-c1 complex subunit 10 n=1 Tax=Zancudomyces culisetae TaxID=1213189 RepID=A0A1R1PQY7_ZANCU|nr:hypothetical protein AX774_g3128 [Zancudomyces culisetae]|eukprot:OMH83368.1 hypothetical protein AX774_g3128 [Zancudomyces culisetae]